MSSSASEVDKDDDDKQRSKIVKSDQRKSAGKSLMASKRY